ncbi:MAG: DUF1232 domain-containing protein, partial [bacterium]
MAESKEPQKRGFTVSGIARGVAHIPHFFKLFFRLLGDPRVPFIAKVVPGAAFLYLLSPFD